MWARTPGAGRPGGDERSSSRESCCSRRSWPGRPVRTNDDQVRAVAGTPTPTPTQRVADDARRGPAHPRLRRGADRADRATGAVVRRQVRPPSPVPALRPRRHHRPATPCPGQRAGLGTAGRRPRAPRGTPSRRPVMGRAGADRAGDDDQRRAEPARRRLAGRALAPAGPYRRRRGLEHLGGHAVAGGPVEAGQLPGDRKRQPEPDEGLRAPQSQLARVQRDEVPSTRRPSTTSGWPGSRPGWWSRATAANRCAPRCATTGRESGPAAGT